MNEDEDYLSLRGPVDFVDGCLVLKIPLEAGGWELHTVAKEISKIIGDDLVVGIQSGLHQSLGSQRERFSLEITGTR